MSIIWKYINKNAIAIEAIRDFENMRSIINNTPAEIKEKYYKLFSPASSKLSLFPKHRELNFTEALTVSLLDKIDILNERYRQAIEYMKWFEPAWSNLSDQEQAVLSEFYSDNLRSGAAVRLMHKINYSERQIHRIREKALRTLSTVLFGK
ncbi:MAG: hypothetical protein LBJ32_00290 [Oscillospiraceae bacterium]|jgi:hypothetical protein|nr:hypothetical protein [Oscillospiraceae bacterium]